jgi:hypothetical protein
MNPYRCTARDLHARIAEKADNLADRLPYPIEREPAHHGTTWREPPLREGWAPVPTMFDVERSRWFVSAVFAIGFLSAFGPLLLDWWQR